MKILLTLLRAELVAGIFGLRLFISGILVVTWLFGAIWMLGAGLTQMLERSGLAMLGGDLAITVVNRPLPDEILARIGALPEVAELSRVAELRSSARAADGNLSDRAPIELKAVDGLYPLYGTAVLKSGGMLADRLDISDGMPGAVVDAPLLHRLSLALGDRLLIGGHAFVIRDVLELEPDRLSAGQFMVGPRVLIDRTVLKDTELLAPGALVDFRYRLRLATDVSLAEARDALSVLTPERGWELESPEDAGDRVRRVVERTATFLGIAGIIALVIGLAGAAAATTAWVGRRARSIALYRLSGAAPALVIQLHAAILAAAALTGIAAGLALSALVAVLVLAPLTRELHLAWDPALLIWPAAEVAAALCIGVLGASAAALSAAARTPPGQAMRSGEAALSPHPRHLLMGGAAMFLSLLMAVLNLPSLEIAIVGLLGLAAAIVLLALCGWFLATRIRRARISGPVGFLSRQGLSEPRAAALKAVAIGIGIAGVTGVLSTQNSLEEALLTEIPDRAPDLVLIDVQPGQVDSLRARVESNPELGGLQADPMMRASILAVNDVPAPEALVREDKSWVIEGDRSFSWSAGPTESELVAGRWWPEDYDGVPLVAPEEDVAQAFDLKPGDTITYSVLGRPFTSEVVAIRKEYHRTLRPEYLMLASAEPFRNAPHSWVMTLQGTPVSIDRFTREIAGDFPNVTAIDVRPLVTQVRQVIDSGVFATLAIAGVLLVIGALTIAAILVADVDARRREALAYTLIGVSRREIALARLFEALAIGAIGAVIGGAAGLLCGAWLADQALGVGWTPGWLAICLPVLLGAGVALSAGMAGRLSSLPRGRGQMARHLAG